MAAEQKRKIRWAISLLLVMLYFSGLPAQAQKGGGTGEPNDPYLIYTAEQMNAIGADANDWDKHFKLMADIDLSGYTGTDFNNIGIDRDIAFTGVFDGNGHTISNFSYTSTDREYIGLFGYVEGEDAEIKDLGLIDSNVDAGTGDDVGSLVGGIDGGTINNCYAEGANVAGHNCVGGLVGTNGGSVLSSYSTGSVSGTGWYVGGLVGSNGGTITNCYSTGTVTGNNSVGGLVGENGWGTITNCYATGHVSGDRYVGGLVGANEGSITSCYATGSVSGNERVGGLVGANSSEWDLEMITNCYSVGSVTGTTDVGGLVGSNDGSVSVSFWDIETSGRSYMCGRQDPEDPEGIGCDNANGKTTAEMQNPNTFIAAGWDFVGQPDGPSDIWAEPVGGGYPILWWQLSPLPELPFAGGTGELDDPYLISTADDLNSIGHNPRLMGAHFKLTNDIDLAGVNFFIIGNELFPFAGVFDGNGKKISNFNYTSTATYCVGLFGYVNDPNAVIKDLGLIDPIVDALAESIGRRIARVGSLVGYNSGAITNCYVEGGSVSGQDTVGGLVGSNYRGTITNCYVEGGSVAGGWGVGGLVGYNYDGTITNCYATGGVSGNSEVGGLVGYNSWGGTITCSYATSKVTGDNSVGGLVGSGGQGVLHSVWDMETSGLTVSNGGVGLATAEMIDPYMLGLNGFANDPNWVLDAGRDYPRLAWEGTPGQIIPEPIIDWLDGQGTEEEPYRVDIADQLILLSRASGLWDKHFILGADINLDPNLQGRKVFSQAVIQVFSGVFDGNGHVISNLHIQGGSYLGLFGQLNSGAEVSNLGLEAINVNGIGTYVGGLVGYSGGNINTSYSNGTVSGNDDVGGLVGDNNGTITTSYSTGTVSGTDSYVGGLVGYNNGTIATSYSTGTVSGNTYVGGLVGLNSYLSNITTSYSTGTVSGNYDVGGLVGWNSGSITTSYSMGTVTRRGQYGGVGGLVGSNSDYGRITASYSTATVSGDRYVGGLVGSNYGSITTSYSMGSVTGTDYIGGLVGKNSETITNCYATGSVTGSGWGVGGLVGDNEESWGTTSNSFWDIETSGQSKSSGGTGKTTAEMQMESTFTDAGWDFVAESVNGAEDIWSICEGTNYPRLAWQIPAGDFVCPEGITIEDFVFFIEYWRDDNCDLSNDYCQGTDLDFSGTVDEADLEILVENWLAVGND